MKPRYRHRRLRPPVFPRYVIHYRAGRLDPELARWVRDMFRKNPHAVVVDSDWTVARVR